MDKEETLFHKIAAEIPNTTEGKMFGALCIKTPNGRSAVMYWKKTMVFKLNDGKEEAALKLKGVKIFEPSKGHKMGGWYQVPGSHSKHWKKFALESVEIVKKIMK